MTPGTGRRSAAPADGLAGVGRMVMTKEARP
jgi:hypothetical protein